MALFFDEYAKADFETFVVPRKKGKKVQAIADPITFSRRLDDVAGRVAGLTSQDGLDSLLQDAELLIRSAVSYDQCRDVIVSLTEQSARHVLDLIRLWLARSPQNHYLHRNAIYLMMRLAKRSRQLPPSLFITGIRALQNSESELQGGFGDIFYGTWSHAGSEHKVVLKRPRVAAEIQKEELFAVFSKEALVLSQLNHPRILPFVGIDRETFALSKNFALVSLHMDQGTLYQFIRTNSYDPSCDRERLLHETAEGLDYLHAQKIVHGDINEYNIFINAQRHAVLADFGISVIGEMTDGRPTTTNNVHGTTPWLAPERLFDGEGVRAQPSCDVYAFACLCLYMHTRRPVWGNMRNGAILQSLSNQERPPRPSQEVCYGPNMTNSMWDLIQSCWRHRPEERYTMSRVLAYFNRDGSRKPGCIFEAVATRDFRGKNPDELTFVIGEPLRVLCVQDRRWRAQNGTGAEGLIPWDSFPDPTMFGITALCDLENEEEGKLSFRNDEILRVLFVNGDTWYAVNEDRVAGNIFPIGPKGVRFTLTPQFKKHTKRTTMRALYDSAAPPNLPFGCSFEAGSLFDVGYINGEWAAVKKRWDGNVALVRTSYLGPILPNTP